VTAKQKVQATEPPIEKPRARRSAADRFLRKEEAPGSNPGESIRATRVR
jgi:hypothetical protein